VNDLPEITTSKTFLFADDTKIYRAIRSTNDSRLLQEDLEKFDKWTETWQLKANPEKCKVIHVRGEGDKTEYRINGKILEHTQKEKDIGLVVDEKLNFNDHIEEKIKKANQIVGLIRRNFTFLTPRIFAQLFKSMVRPHLEYAEAIWSPNNINQIDAIEAVQRRATKLINGFKDLNYKERLQKLNLPTLLYRRLRGDLIETYKILNDKYENDTTVNMIELNNERIQRGHNQKIKVRYSRTNIRKNFLINRIANTWNNLPKKLIECKSTNSFKNNLDRYAANLDILYDFNNLKENRDNINPSGTGRRR
jgi:hypothetical protein